MTNLISSPILLLVLSMILKIATIIILFIEKRTDFNIAYIFIMQEIITTTSIAMLLRYSNVNIKSNNELDAYRHNYYFKSIFGFMYFIAGLLLITHLLKLKTFASIPYIIAHAIFLSIITKFVISSKLSKL